MITFKPKPSCAAQLREAAPLELVRVNSLRASGLLRDLFLSKPGYAWVILQAPDHGEVERLRELPMYPYLDVIIDALTN
jgi:muconolactone delta-isomerase